MGFAASVRYAVFGWKQPTPTGPDIFSSHDQGMVRLILATVAGLTVVETIVIHILVWQASPALSWVLTAGSLAGLVALLGLHQSLRLMPHMLLPDTLAVSAGTSGTVLVPLADIAAARRTADPPPREAPGHRVFGFMPETVVLLDLARPVTARLPFGMTQELTRLSLVVDEPDRLLRALAARGVPVA
ncbi:MAG: hypothetical protein RLY86_4109 [Pseudomonadota bacterium]|jgi:hypothetical protein